MCRTPSPVTESRSTSSSNRPRCGAPEDGRPTCTPASEPQVPRTRAPTHGRSLRAVSRGLTGLPVEGRSRAPHPTVEVNVSFVRTPDTGDLITTFCGFSGRGGGGVGGGGGVRSGPGTTTLRLWTGTLGVSCHPRPRVPPPDTSPRGHDVSVAEGSGPTRRRGEVCRREPLGNPSWWDGRPKDL